MPTVRGLCSSKSFIAATCMIVWALIISVGVFIGFGHRKTVNGQSLTITGPMPGVMFVFDSTGAPLSQYYCTLLTGNTTNSGTFSLTGTGPLNSGSALWTNPGGAWLDDIRVTSAGTAIAQSYTAYPVSLSVSSNTITLTGSVYSPTTLVVLGATAVTATTPKSISAKVCSN